MDLPPVYIHTIQNLGQSICLSLYTAIGVCFSCFVLIYNFISELLVLDTMLKFLVLFGHGALSLC